MAPSERLKQLVKVAARMEDPLQLSGCSPFLTTTRSGEKVTCRSYYGNNLPAELNEWVYELFERNMGEMYRKSDSGHDEDNKKLELFASTARYIIVFNDEDQPIGYTHFRFDEDFDHVVLYCYELQVEPEYQRKGIGAIMMSLMEKMAQVSGMQKVMATVFTFNAQSLKFFRKNKFTNDETNPHKSLGLDYYILSKRIKALKK